MIHIAICEDNAGELAHIHSMIRQTDISCDVTEYTSAESLLFDIETNRKQFHLFLLDIYLSGLNGVEAARRIRALDEKALLIFLTVSENFYREAFDLYAFHYLLKPVNLADLSEVLRKANDQIAAPEETLHITFRRQNMILRLASITYIDSFNHALRFHMQDGQEYTSYGRLDEIQAEISSDLFVRCHKSFIINLIHVDKMTREGFYIGNTLIPISRTYAADAKERYRRKLFDIFQDK